MMYRRDADDTDDRDPTIDRSDIALLAFAPLLVLLAGLLIGAFAGLIVLGFRLTSGG